MAVKVFIEVWRKTQAIVDYSEQNIWLKSMIKKVVNTNGNMNSEPVKEVKRCSYGKP